jgi:hypothetical protein
LVDLLRAMPLSDGKVRFAWRAAVGPALQRATAVKLEGTQLIVEAATPQWGQEVRRSSRVILSRLQTWLGRESVAGIVVRT